ncbi:MAG: TrkA C-terminal domain-containing protein [Bacillota bacterium]|nr:TrkA C-terminal domain-containing protein [Bacillota bacterium]
MNPVENPIENQESENKTSKYEKIALDIAYSIVNDEWKMGDIIKGRSTLSGKYSVSPETIRRALKLLEELHVVEVIEKKGMLIKSKTAAVAYIKEYQSKDHVLSLRENIAKMIDEKRVIEDNMLVKLDKLIEEAVLLKNVGIIYPLEFKIPEGSPLIGRSIGDIRFWEHTGATIIGINRTGELVLSPGPKLVFFEGDVVFYVGNSPGNSERVNKFIKSTE